MHKAHRAFADAAAELRSGQFQVVSQRPQQRVMALALDHCWSVVDFKLVFLYGCIPPGCSRRVDCWIRHCCIPPLTLTILPGLASRNFVVLAATSLLTTSPPVINSAPDTFGSQITAEHFVPLYATAGACHVGRLRWARHLKVVKGSRSDGR